MADAAGIMQQTATETDIFQSLKKTNEALVDVLTRQQQPVYVSSPAPVSASPAPNYLLYVGIGILVLFFVMRK